MKVLEEGLVCEQDATPDRQQTREACLTGWGGREKADSHRKETEALLTPNIFAVAFWHSSQAGGSRHGYTCAA